MKKIAILYQAELPPIKDGVQKPMKPGGYSDSGADIANELNKNGIPIVTPVVSPKIENDLDWVFPDTKLGIQNALNKDAKLFWLNTVLHKDHPIVDFFNSDIEVIGQIPSKVDIYDDKWMTNKFLKANNIPIPKATQISQKQKIDNLNFNFPLVLKPIRGRGSQGVFLIQNQIELRNKLSDIFMSQEFGTSVYVEEYLSGQEITITVMPSGTYQINSKLKIFDKPWCLPAVKRFNHQNGIAPYNGVVAIIQNSSILSKDERHTPKIKQVYDYCKKAGELLDIKAPIRIDCRADSKGNYYLFDLNMKPNMTGPSRAHRQKQDSLTSLAARGIGWSYFELLENMIKQAW